MSITSLLSNVARRTTTPALAQSLIRAGQMGTRSVSNLTTFQQKVDVLKRTDQALKRSEEVAKKAEGFFEPTLKTKDVAVQAAKLRMEFLFQLIQMMDKSYLPERNTLLMLYNTLSSLRVSSHLGADSGKTHFDIPRDLITSDCMELVEKMPGFNVQWKEAGKGGIVLHVAKRECHRSDLECT